MKRTAILPRRNHRCRMGLTPNGKGMHPVAEAACLAASRQFSATTADEPGESGAVSQRNSDRGRRDHENPQRMLRC